MMHKRFIPAILLGLVVMFATGCEEGTLTFEGFVWEDQDGSGVKEAGEPPLSSVTVHLINPETGEIIDKTTTDENGRYAVTPIQLAQQMRIEVQIPNEMAVTIQPNIDGQNPNAIVNEVGADGFSRVFDPNTIDRPGGQETTVSVHAGFTRPPGVSEAAPPAPPTSSPEPSPTEPPPTETPEPSPSATPEPSPTATELPTPTAEPTEVSQIIEPIINSPDEPLDELMITFFGGNVRSCQSGAISEQSGFAKIFSFTYPMGFGMDQNPDIQLTDRFSGEILLNPPLPVGTQVCAGVGFFNPTNGTLPQNLDWAFDQVGSGSFFTCTFPDGTQQSGYSVYTDSIIEQYSLTEDSSAAIDRKNMTEYKFGGISFAIHKETLNIFDESMGEERTFSTYDFDIPRWLLRDSVSIGPTATDGQSCTESGLSEDLSGTYRLPLYLRIRNSHDQNTACFVTEDCGPFVQYESGPVIREGDIYVNFNEDAFTLADQPSDNFLTQLLYRAPIGKYDPDSNTLTVSDCQKEDDCNVFQTGKMTIIGQE